MHHVSICVDTPRCIKWDDGKMCSFSCAYVLVITLYTYLAPWNIFISSFDPVQEKTSYRQQSYVLPTPSLRVCYHIFAESTRWNFTKRGSWPNLNPIEMLIQVNMQVSIPIIVIIRFPSLNKCFLWINLELLHILLRPSNCPPQRTHSPIQTKLIKLINLCNQCESHCTVTRASWAF